MNVIRSQSPTLPPVRPTPQERPSWTTEDKVMVGLSGLLAAVPMAGSFANGFTGLGAGAEVGGWLGERAGAPGLGALAGAGVGMVGGTLLGVAALSQQGNPLGVGLWCAASALFGTVSAAVLAHTGAQRRLETCLQETELGAALTQAPSAFARIEAAPDRLEVLTRTGALVTREDGVVKVNDHEWEFTRASLSGEGLSVYVGPQYTGVSKSQVLHKDGSMEVVVQAPDLSICAHQAPDGSLAPAQLKWANTGTSFEAPGTLSSEGRLTVAGRSYDLPLPPVAAR